MAEYHYWHKLYTKMISLLATRLWLIQPHSSLSGFWSIRESRKTCPADCADERKKKNQRRSERKGVPQTAQMNAERKISPKNKTQRWSAKSAGNKISEDPQDQGEKVSRRLLKWKQKEKSAKMRWLHDLLWRQFTFVSHLSSFIFYLPNSCKMDLYLIWKIFNDK